MRTLSQETIREERDGAVTSGPLGWRLAGGAA